MFEIEWAQESTWRKEGHSVGGRSSLSPESVQRACLLLWEEHCLECAAPLCFSSCSMYSPRSDEKCARFAYGIYPNPAVQGLLDFGADIRFRRWGKLVALMLGRYAGIRVHRFLDRVARSIAQPVRDTSGSAFSARLTLNRARSRKWRKILWTKVRDKSLLWSAARPKKNSFDAFVLECFSPQSIPVRLLFEFAVGELDHKHTFCGQIKFRHSFDIAPGWNFQTLPSEAFALADDGSVGELRLYPENNAEPRLIFTWLDLVQFQRGAPIQVKSREAILALPATKVKCVAWDLDNTLWSGILAEASENHLQPRPEAMELIRKLDNRGILQTIVSKNNHDDVWPILEHLKLQDYFLYPAVNWMPKSANLKQIAAALNINIDTFALIDDSAFERAEVQSALPQARVYSDRDVPRLLSFPEFDVPVTEMSKSRRASYLIEIKRQRIQNEFRGDYEGFLRSCQMKLRLFVPREQKHVERCLELIQRSNQLNLSSRRYSAEEFQQLLSSSNVLSIAMECKDRFGDYGIVGFASVDEAVEIPTLRDLVLSCRVAQKRVEHTLVRWLGRRELDRGKTALAAEMVRTERNQPIRQVFDDLGFRQARQEEARCRMEWQLVRGLPVDDLIELEDTTLAPVPGEPSHPRERFSV